MMHFPIVPPQPIIDPVSGVQVGTLDQTEAYLALTLTASFCEGKQGPDAADFAEEAQVAIRAEALASRARGYWSLENEHQRALKRACETLPYQGARAAAWRAHQKAVIAASKDPPGAAARPVEANGVAAEQPS